MYYVGLKLVNPNVKFLFSCCKADSNVDTFKSIVINLLARKRCNFGFAYFRLLEMDLCLKNFIYF